MNNSSGFVKEAAEIMAGSLGVGRSRILPE
jgi:hypothetical protein